MKSDGHEDKYDEVGEKWYALNHDDNYLNHDAHSVNCRDYDGHGRNSKSSWREKLQQEEESHEDHSRKYDIVLRQIL